MSETLFFYDLETTGRNRAESRVMQFAGQRTDMELQPVDEPVNCLIRITPDILPEPGAILLHGISPQQTLEEGFTESEFLCQFYDRAVIKDTVFVGYNNIGFDDDFMRYMNYRNLYEPYGWQYEQHRSRWDILPLVRLTRALRPEGINWPPEGNRLEDMAKVNHLSHDHAHDAMSDVMATIAVARMIKTAQPKLYDYLLSLRDKRRAARLADAGKPFVYTSVVYPAEQLHTTVVSKLSDGSGANRVLVYDLRQDPALWVNRSPEELKTAWYRNPDRPADVPLLPVNEVELNRCPAIAPLGVIKEDDQQRLGIDPEVIMRHERFLAEHRQVFLNSLRQAEGLLPPRTVEPESDRPVDVRLYDAFFSDHDRVILKSLGRHDDPEKVRQSGRDFQDERLRQLVTLFIARNYPASLTTEEHTVWENYRQERLLSGGNDSRMAVFMQALEDETAKLHDAKERLLLEDLRLYAESLLPSE